MKGKTKTYMLLVGVLAIWGIIGFKMLGALNPKPPKTLQQDLAVSFNPQINTAVDTFSIRAVDRDPFLGTLYKKKKTIVKRKSAQPKEEFVWPSVIYHGTVAKQQSKSQIFVISINGQQYLMKVGQDIGGIKLRFANAKVITITSKGHRKTINKA
ncbi:hypothetical protein [Flavivirga jejuensis]|uniref:Uncharacterized protein n=1 Tax=Flavivirga jejuensis TaxID=870487 RepID=A0ABT8WMY1_9FLAO|nr:hypothetical protein [Flavivirga jejuensis]MDO5974522.1 hypothetical protein [Flavivirga jejuensis]